tara:strand:- start:110 stop:457 length:348 start_codon:yes stop_codon:yes gene_type:complete
MASENDFLLISLIYLTSSAVFYLIFWRYICAIKSELCVYMLRGLLASLIFTPWFVNIQEGIMGPALMIAMLDLITLGSGEFFRAGVPLFLSIFTIEAIAIGLYVFIRKSDRKTTS